MSNTQSKIKSNMTSKQQNYLLSILTEDQKKQLSNYILDNPTTSEDLNETAICALENALNVCGFNFDCFVKSTTKWHRYIQNEFFKLAAAVIRLYGSDDYKYDGRNEYAHRVAKEILANNQYL